MREKTITRETAIGSIRKKLITMTESDKSVCQIAAEKNILCRGFHRDTDDELRWRYADKIPGALGMSRYELEDKANSWQLERQRSEGMFLCCDVQNLCYETCRAWDEFSNEDLARFCRELALAGQPVRVSGRISPPIV